MGPLLRGGEFLLTTGLGLRGTSAADLGRYVEAIADAGLAALALELGRTFSEVPEAVLRAAARRRLTVVALREVVPFAAMVEAFHRAGHGRGGQRPAPRRADLAGADRRRAGPGWVVRAGPPDRRPGRRRGVPRGARRPRRRGLLSGRGRTRRDPGEQPRGRRRRRALGNAGPRRPARSAPDGGARPRAAGRGPGDAARDPDRRSGRRRQCPAVRRRPRPAALGRRAPGALRARRVPERARPAPGRRLRRRRPARAPGAARLDRPAGLHDRLRREPRRRGGRGGADGRAGAAGRRGGPARAAGAALGPAVRLRRAGHRPRDHRRRGRLTGRGARGCSPGPSRRRGRSPASRGASAPGAAPCSPGTWACTACWSTCRTGRSSRTSSASSSAPSWTTTPRTAPSCCARSTPTSGTGSPRRRPPSALGIRRQTLYNRLARIEDAARRRAAHRLRAPHGARCGAARLAAAHRASTRGSGSAAGYS